MMITSKKSKQTMFIPIILQCNNIDCKQYFEDIFFENADGTCPFCNQKSLRFKKEYPPKGNQCGEHQRQPFHERVTEQVKQKLRKIVKRQVSA
ncbi:MAG: hypothetical protein ACFFG0_41835, partial [Candidatus Thorarchaeota archaeon]